jgi:hypothetical protein
MHWERFSLSQRERAGVRGKKSRNMDNLMGSATSSGT